MIVVDGGHGEGGGQILRTSLGLSLVTGEPFRIENIRAGRSKPGLMRQHLTAVQAAAQVGQAKVEGDTLGSQSLFFQPKAAQGGSYRFAIGTAGSCTLVLQTVLPSLLLAKAPSELVLEGGTHNPYAPPFDFLAHAFLPLLNRMGVQVEAELATPGFYPAGGGKVRVHITPTAQLQPLHLLERGAIRSKRVVARVAQIPESVAVRELDVMRGKLSGENVRFQVQVIENSCGPGNVLVVFLECEELTEVFTGFGEKSVKAEFVAKRLVDEVREYLVADVPVGPYMADQLLIPLALAGGGSFRTLRPTPHTQTNIEVIRQFLEVSISLSEEANKTWLLSVGTKDSQTNSPTNKGDIHE